MMTKTNKLGKVIAVSAACVLGLSAVACGSDVAVDGAPEIVGASDFDCIINEPVDLLQRVAALDPEDGDLTPKMQISISPSAEIHDGIAVFTQQTEYEVTYSVTDSAGHTVTATSYVSTYARPVYKAFDLMDPNGYSLNVAGGAKLVTQSVKGDGDMSNMYFEVTGAANDGDLVLSRTFELAKGHDYSISCTFAKSNVAGTAKVKVGDNEPMEIPVVVDENGEGSNTWSFDYGMTQATEDENLKIELMLGGLGDDIKMEFDNATVSYEEEADPLGYEMEFKKGNNTHDRFDGTQGSVTVADGGTSATVAITQVASGNDVRWRGGMFLNTGLTLNPGTQYVISYDLAAAQTNEFSVMIQDKQWDEHEYVTKNYSGEATYHDSVTITANAAFERGLWLYVKSGDNLNEITISNLTVEYAGDSTLAINSTYCYKNIFKMFAAAGAPNYAEWKDGKLLFHVDAFGNTDWHNKIEGPDFDLLMGEFGDYYVSFKAKANKPVTVTCIGPRSGGWEPNLIWSRFAISESETLYTIRSNAVNLPGPNHLEFQFGEVNPGITDVTIEISDIVIYTKSFIDG